MRRIQGNLHGSIDISDVEDKAIAHRFFQRLRRINQTSFLSMVFPGASHSRLEHSLGVMHLAGLAWARLEDNQRRLKQHSDSLGNYSKLPTSLATSLSSSKECHGLLSPTFPLLNEVFRNDYNLQALRLAALLHDIGHPPFSHSGERFLPPIATLLEDCKNIPPYIRNWLETNSVKNSADAKSERIDLNGKTTHETYTLLLIPHIINDIYREFEDLELHIEAQDVASILQPEISPVATSPLSRNHLHRLCHELLSGEIDIDRMDYLLRDSKECGVVYGIFDINRIMNSLAFYFQQEDNSLHLAINLSGLAAFEDYLRARQSMYLQLYFHRTSVACDAMLQQIHQYLEEWYLPSQLDDYIQIDEGNMPYKLGASLMMTNAKRQASLPLQQQTIDDLFFKRQLWKRVYESNTTDTRQGGRDEVIEAEETLKKQGITYQVVSSENHLTTFKARRPGQASSNYLRLIKKDSCQIHRVVPIEDYSPLVSDENRVYIYRIYVPAGTAKEAQKCIVDSLSRTKLGKS